MSEGNLLTITLGPLSLAIRADRETEKITETPSKRKSETRRAAPRCKTGDREPLGIIVGWRPGMQVEW